MNERLNNIIDKLSMLYDVSISWDYAFFDGVYRILVRHNSYYKDHTRDFGKYIYILNLETFGNYTKILWRK